MKTFTNKNVIHKIVITILIVLSFNFIAPNYSQAGFGGVLMGPIIDLLSGIGDVVLSALQYFMYDGEISLSSGADAVVNTVGTIINPFDSFMLMRSSDDFDDQLEKYDMDTSESADITIDSDNFDKGWLGWVPGSGLDKDYGVPIIKYTPEAIFGNKVPALDVNFINPTDWTEEDGISEEEGENMNEHSITQDLHETIANWYIALRNLALVILLSVLLYVGIRMVISSASSEKAKYKQMLMDWIVAVCILFFLHYIMSFILSVTDIITDGISDSSSIVVEVEDTDGDVKIKTDLTGLVRLQVQYEDLGARLIYLIFYLALVIYTVMFTWTYIKRAITMAFLTLMAPLVAITYPIDKIGDGKAQAFGIWLKEFIFNSLLQPFHLIIYTIFMGAASDIATKNPIYAILFLAFIIPAEKLLRKMFGFEKSNTAGAMSTAAGIFGGAAAFRAVSGLVSKGANVAKSVKGGAGNIRTKKPIEQKGPSVSDAFGGSTSISNGRTQNSSSIASSSLQTNNILSGQDNISGEQSNGAYLPPAETPSGIILPMSVRQDMAQEQARANRQQLSQATQDRNENLKKAHRASSANDTRGLGAYLRDGISGTWRNSNTRAAIVGPAQYIRQKGESAKALADSINQKKNNFVNGIPKPLRNSARGAVAVAGRVGKAGLKAAGAVTMAGVGATVGLAAGIAGDDLEDVLKYGAAGATLGATGLPALGRGIASGVSGAVSNISNTYSEAAYGIDATTLAAQEKEWKESSANEEAMVQTFREMNDGRAPSKKEKEAIMSAGATYYNSGITETKDIRKSVKLEKEIKDRLTNDGMNEDEANERARKQAIVVSKMVNEAKPEQLRDEKYVTNLRNDLSKQLINGGMEKAQSEQQARNIVNMVKKQKGIATD